MKALVLTYDPQIGLAELVVRGSTAPAPPAMAFVPSMAAALAQPSVAS
jgi:hypothetical protein